MCELSAILVNWNAGAELVNTLSALYQALAVLGGETEVLLVDNASTDGSAKAAAQKFPTLNIVYNTSNLGFGTANNIGFARARGRYVLLVNPDLRVTPAALQAMLDFLQAHPQAGICGPKVFEADGTTLSPWCARRDLRPLDVFFEYAYLPRLFPRHRLFARYVMGDWDHSDDRQVEALTGACLLVRREVIGQVGGFHENFFMYGEDLDWCRRIRHAGWQVWFIAEAAARHVGGYSTRQTGDHGARWALESHLCYFRQWGSPFDLFKVRIALSIGSLARACAWLFGACLQPAQFRYRIKRAATYLKYSGLAWRA